MSARALEDRLFGKLKADLAMWEIAWEKKAGPGMVLRLMLLEGGFQFVTLLRLTEASARLPLIGSIVSILLQYWTNRFFACDIARRVRLGGGLFIPHPTGIVIGADVVTGRHVSIMHQVTIGRVRPEIHSSPRIGDGVYLGPGVKVMGDLIIGDEAMVGANAVVLKDIPPRSVAVGAPARVVRERDTTFTPDGFTPNIRTTEQA